MRSFRVTLPLSGAALAIALLQCNLIVGSPRDAYDPDASDDVAISAEPRALLLRRGGTASVLLSPATAPWSTYDVTFRGLPDGVAASLALDKGVPQVVLTAKSDAPDAIVGKATKLEIVATTRSRRTLTTDVAVTTGDPAGRLDLSFGTRGITAVSVADVSVANGMVILPSDAIVVGGWSRVLPHPPDLTVVGFDRDGLLDMTFGTRGVTINDVGTKTDDRAETVALLPNGRIALAGATGAIGGSDVLYAVYDSHGALDPSVAGRGIVKSDLGATEETATGATATKDGMLVVVGTVRVGDPAHNDFAVVRYAQDGRIDPAFNGGKPKIIPLAEPSASDQAAAAVAVAADGSIVVVGIGGGFIFLRLLPNGDLDPRFGGDGQVYVRRSSNAGAGAVALQGDKIIALGFSAESGGTDLMMVRLGPDGARDASFGVDGVVVSPLTNSDEFGVGLTVDEAAGTVVVGGNTGPVGAPVPAGIFLARFRLSNGSLDEGFGERGITRTANPSGSTELTMKELSIQKDGRLVAGGHALFGTDLRFVLARYWP